MTKSIIPTFITGIISPELASSIDLDKARTGLIQCENFIVDALGGVKNRPGTQFIDKANDTTKLPRLIRFQFNVVQSYILVFGDSNMMVIKDSALVLLNIVDAAVYKWTLSPSDPHEYYQELLAGGDPGLLKAPYILEDGSKMTEGTIGVLNPSEWGFGDNDTLGYNTNYVRLSDSSNPYLKADGYLQQPVVISTPYSTSDIVKIDGDAQSADTLYILHADYRRWKITRTSHTAWIVTEITQADGPYRAIEDGDRLITINATEGVPWTLKASAPIFNDTAVGDPIRLGSPVPGDLTALHWAVFYVDGVASDTQITATPVEDEQEGIVYEEILNWTFRKGINFWLDYSDTSASLTYDATNRAALLTQGTAGANAKMEQSILTLSQVKHKFEMNFSLTGTYPAFKFKIGTTSFGAEIYDSGSISSGVGLAIELKPIDETIYLSFDTEATALLSIRNGTYKWTLSDVIPAAGIFYLELIAGGDPGLKQPADVYENSVALTFEASPSGALSRWSYGDFESVPLTYDTIYVKLNPAVDPDTKAVDWVEADFAPDSGDVVKITNVSWQKRDSAPTTPQEQNTTDWRLADFNANRGFPERGIIHEQRFIPARNAENPQTLWPTETGNFESYGFNTPTRDTDSFSFNPPTPGINGIEWLLLQNGLNVGTAGETWKVFAASGGVITPSDTNIKVDSAVGSLSLKPITIGNSIIATPRGKEEVVELTSSFETSGYTKRDLSVLASHLFKDRRIVRWAYAREPDSVIWCILDNGKLLGLTYFKEYDIWAWHEHTTPLGEGFKDIAVIPNSSDDNIDDVYFIINRAVAGATPNYYIEQLNRRITSQEAAFGLQASGSPYDYKFLDSALTFDIPITITNATQAEPVVITASAHGFSDGDFVKIQNVKGMTEINNIKYKVANKAANTFELTDKNDNDIDGTGFTAYLTGGEVRKMELTLSGLDHLEGETVTALADGRVQTGLVVSGGSITLSQVTSFAHSGVPYESIIETPDIEILADTGSTQGRFKGITKADIYFKDARGAEIASSNKPDDYWEIPFYSESDGDNPPELFTGSKEITLSSDYKKTDRILIRGKSALPIEIKRIIPDVNYGG